LREKDHFERQYKKHLSKRLLANKAPNEGTAVCYTFKQALPASAPPQCGLHMNSCQ
jgi:hypothetical protein